MPSSKHISSIALGVAMLIVWTAATVHVESRANAQKAAMFSMKSQVQGPANQGTLSLDD
jgi:hypothetical protein